MTETVVRGPLLVPDRDGAVAFHFDGALAADAGGTLLFAGPFDQLREHLTDQPVRQSAGVMLPPLLDVHTHIPQHPIRGRFAEGVDAALKHEKLLAGLNRNVFPVEAKCADGEYAATVVRQFLADTLSHGVVGGATYMTPSVAATEVALSILPATWTVGLVLMNQNCPANLRTDETGLAADVERLARQYGRRLIVTDRFAVAVTSPLRRQASGLAGKFGLRTQTHLNEQVTEKQFVEEKLYPGYSNYTNVYRTDGLLDHQCILAHCIQMTDVEWQIVRDSGSCIAHCPTSNLLLDSGVMRLDEVCRRGIPYALATDVGASPTVSMLAEMKRFVSVHTSVSGRATATEALYRSTRAPAEMLGLGDQLGALEVGRPMSFIEVNAGGISGQMTADQVVGAILPDDVDHPALAVNRVTLGGRTAYERSGGHA